MHPSDFVEKVKTKEDFIQFIQLLVQDLRKHKDTDKWGEEWAHVTLEGYLDALGRWVEDTPRYNPDHSLNNPNHPLYSPRNTLKEGEVDWGELALLLYVAKIYE